MLYIPICIPYISTGILDLSIFYVFCIPYIYLYSMYFVSHTSIYILCILYSIDISIFYVFCILDLSIFYVFCILDLSIFYVFCILDLSIFYVFCILDLSAIVGFDGVPLHFMLFPKLWLDIYNSKYIQYSFTTFIYCVKDINLFIKRHSLFH